MRAITVRQPWAWAIIHGGKDVENRSRNIAGSYRGPVAIHAGLAAYDKDNDASRVHRATHDTETDARIHFGAIIGLVDLVEVHQATPDEFGQIRCSVGARMGTWARSCSDWAGEAEYHLVLANPRPCGPIACRGALGLWTVPDCIAAALAEAVGSE